MTMKTMPETGKTERIHGGYKMKEMISDRIIELKVISIIVLAFIIAGVSLVTHPKDLKEVLSKRK